MEFEGERCINNLMHPKIKSRRSFAVPLSEKFSYFGISRNFCEQKFPPTPLQKTFNAMLS